MKAKINKQFLRPNAIRHYAQSNEIYCFMSLYDDNEPYPIEEVIELQRAHIEALQAELKLCPSEFMQGQILKARQQLDRLEKRKQQIDKPK